MVLFKTMQQKNVSSEPIVRMVLAKPFVRMVLGPKAAQNGPKTRGGSGAVLMKVWAQTCCDRHQQKSSGLSIVALQPGKSIIVNHGNPILMGNLDIQHDFLIEVMYMIQIFEIRKPESEKTSSWHHAVLSKASIALWVWAMGLLRQAALQGAFLPCFVVGWWLPTISDV